VNPQHGFYSISWAFNAGVCNVNSLHSSLKTTLIKTQNRFEKLIDHLQKQVRILSYDGYCYQNLKDKFNWLVKITKR